MPDGLCNVFVTENVHLACCRTEVKLGEWVVSEMLYVGLKDVRVVSGPEVSCAVPRQVQVRALLCLLAVGQGSSSD